MVSVGVLVCHGPRLTAAVSFGRVGSILPAPWFLPSMLSRGDGVALMLFILLPGMAAALAGALAGVVLRGPARSMGQRAAVVRGAAVATLALVIFAPLFALLFSYTTPGRTSKLGMTIQALTFSMLAVWWVVAPIGGTVGGLLHHFASDCDAA